MLTACFAFVAMAQARLEAVSQIPPLLVVSCVKGTINSVTLSTNTVSTSLDGALGTSGSDSQLIGLVEVNATKQSTDTQDLQMVQIVQAPANAPEGNNFPAFQDTCGDILNTGDIENAWTAIQVWSNVDPTSSTAFVYTNSTQLTRATFDSSYGATIAASQGSTFCDQIAILTFYAVDDAGNATADGTYRAFFMITFNDV